MRFSKPAVCVKLIKYSVFVSVRKTISKPNSRNFLFFISSWLSVSERIGTRFRHLLTNHPFMLKNYLLTAWRNFWKNRTFSFINTAGLALGMTCSLLIMLWIQDERRVDKFHANDKNLYSVLERQYYDGKIEAFHGTPGLLAEEMKKVLPEVKYAANMAWPDKVAFASGDRIIKQEGTSVGKDFFNIFSFPL